MNYQVVEVKDYAITQILCKGTYDECVAYLQKHKAKGATEGNGMDLLQEESGRLCSWVG